MEYGFNEILLVKFITKYFAFEPIQELVNHGITIFGKIVTELVEENRNLQNLKRKDMKEIISGVLG